MAITLDRYVAIAHPLHYLRVTPKTTWIVITIVWIATLLVTISYWLPIANYQEEPKETDPYPVCIDPGKPWYKLQT